MNYQTKKEALVKEYNTLQQRVTALQQQISQSANRQVQIQGELKLIEELEKEEQQVSTKVKE